MYHVFEAIASVAGNFSQDFQWNILYPKLNYVVLEFAIYPLRYGEMPENKYMEIQRYVTAVWFHLRKG